MNYKTLGDICNVKSSKRIYQSEYCETGVPFYRGKEISQLQRNESLDVELFISREKYEDIKEKYGVINEGDLLITSVGTIGNTWVSDGREFYYKDGNITQIEKNSNINTKFLSYLFKSDIIKNQYLKGTSGTAQVALTIEKLKKLKVPDVNLITQSRIVEVLDKAQELVNNKKEQIELLDKLVKSRFIEMFGDPAFNHMNWDVVELSSLLRERASNGFFAKNDEYKTDGNAKVMWLGDIINRRYSNTKDLKQVDVTDTQLNKFRVKYGDLLFCRSSLTKEGIGKASAVPKNVDDNIMFECHVIRTPLDLSKCVPEFIQIQSTMDYFRNQIMSNSKTSTMTTIGQEGIIKTKVTLPDLDSQKKFVDFVNQVDKLKFKMENSLKELEDNFNSLMQRAFKGDLFK